MHPTRAYCDKGICVSADTPECKDCDGAKVYLDMRGSLRYQRDLPVICIWMLRGWMCVYPYAGFLCWGPVLRSLCIIKSVKGGGTSSSIPVDRMPADAVLRKSRQRDAEI